MPDETPSQPPPNGPAPAPDPARRDPTTYDLEPAPIPPPPPPPTPGKLSEKGLTEDFPEDADFTHDPEVEKALKGDKAEVSKATVDEAAEPAQPFTKPGMGDAKTIALIGAGLAIAAVIAAALDSTTGHFSAAVLTVYFIFIHTITGVGAVAGAAHLNDQPIGPIELAAGRMLAAVSMFMFLLNVHVTSYHFISAIFAAVLYWLTLTVLFRISTGKLLTVAIMHAGFALIIWLGMVIYSWATTPLTKPA
jgi:hypothetical protein